MFIFNVEIRESLKLSQVECDSEVLEGLASSHAKEQSRCLFDLSSFVKWLKGFRKSFDGVVEQNLTIIWLQFKLNTKTNSMIRKLRERDVVQVLLDLAHLQQEKVFVAVIRNHVVINFRSNSERKNIKDEYSVGNGFSVLCVVVLSVICLSVWLFPGNYWKAWESINHTI